MTRAISELASWDSLKVPEGDPPMPEPVWCAMGEGGVPWKLAAADADTAHIGLSYAIRSGSDGQQQFVTCCSQVFDAAGAGLEFVAYDTSDVVVFRENPFLSRTEMARIMARSLSLYQRRHAGQSPRRFVIQKATEFKRDEVDGCFDALEAAAEKIELLHVQQTSSWRGIQIDRPSQQGEKGQAARFPVRRGTCLTLGSRELLLWTQGSQREIAPKGRTFYKCRAPRRSVRLLCECPGVLGVTLRVIGGADDECGE